MLNVRLLFGLSLSVILLACSAQVDEGGTVVPWLDPLSTPEGPFPSDAYVREDSSSPTGYQVDLSALRSGSLPERAIGLFDGDALDNVRGAMEALDGFSGFAPIFIPFSGALDADSVQASDFRLVDLNDGVTVPVRASYLGGSGSWVLLHPLSVLRPTHRHAVLIGRGLNDLVGAPILGAQRFPMKDDELSRALEVADFGRGDIAGAFAFVVQDTTGELIAVSNAVNDAPAPDIFDVSRPSARVIEGSFRSPDYRVRGIIPRVEAGASPTPVSENTLRFYLKLPVNYDTAPRPFPLAIWAHGLTGDRRSIPDVEDTAVIAIDAVEHGHRASIEEEAFIAFIFNDFLHVLRTRDNYRQTVVDNMVLARLLPALDEQLQVALSEGPLLYTERFGYIGGSLGGIVGGSAIPLSPQLENGIVVVGGAGLSKAFEEGLFMLTAPNVTFAHTPLERRMFFALVQTIFDRADGVNYLRHAIREPLPGHAPRNLLFTQVIGDPLVPNSSNETWAWAAGLEWLGPVHQNLYDLPVLDTPTAAGNIEVDGTARTGIAYQYNPPADEVVFLKRHGYLANHAGARGQIEHFFRTALDTGVGEVLQGE